MTEKCCEEKIMEQTAEASCDGSIFKYWLHRVSYEGDVAIRLLVGGYLSIGWSWFADSGIESVVNPNSDAQKFEAIMREHNEESRSRWGLFRFLQFNKGDIVVVPLFDGKFSIYRVVGKPMPVSKMTDFAELEMEDGSKIVRNKTGLFIREKTNKIVDLGFVIKVEPIKERLSRYKYADSALTARMKIRPTNVDISDLKESIKNVINANSPVNLYSSIIEDLAGTLLDAIKKQLRPDKFEYLVRWYFIKLGASNVFIPAKNSPDKKDGADADVIAEFAPLKITIDVQAKFHVDNTDQWAVEQISKYKEQHESGSNETVLIPWVISTADGFSDQAIAMAQENKVRLISGKEFACMLLDAGITNINDAFCREQ